MTKQHVPIKLSASGIAPHFQRPREANARVTGGWNEPQPDRGWLFAPNTEYPGSSLGNYLDYGPNHYRSGHEYCGLEGGCICRLRQPGNVHAIVYVGRGAKSRYFETIGEAKTWIEAEARKNVGRFAHGR